MIIPASGTETGTYLEPKSFVLCLGTKAGCVGFSLDVSRLDDVGFTDDDGCLE